MWVRVLPGALSNQENNLRNLHPMIIVLESMPYFHISLHGIFLGTVNGKDGAMARQMFSEANPHMDWRTLSARAVLSS